MQKISCGVGGKKSKIIKELHLHFYICVLCAAIHTKSQKGEVREETYLKKLKGYHNATRKDTAVVGEFIRNSVVVGGIDDQWEVDLADLSMLSRHNYNYKYLMQCIDIFSCFAWSILMKTKTCAKTASKNFEN